MNYEQDKEFSHILEGMDLNKILDASLDDSPELLSVAWSLTTEVHKVEGLAPLQGCNGVLHSEEGSCQEALLFIFTIFVLELQLPRGK